MKIFTKMKHALLVVAAMCCVGTAFAVDVTTSYAVVAEDVASDNKVSVEGITLTYGTEATWKTGSATVTVDSKTFTLYATGDNGPSPANGNIPTSGVYVVFEPEHDGTITAVVQNAGNTKSGYIVEDEAQNLVNGTVLIDGVETAWTSGTPFNSAAAYSGGVTFNVKAGSKYYFYMAGSKMRFMGFLYTYDDGYGIVWSQDFENEDTFSEGWTECNLTQNQIGGSKYLHVYSGTNKNSCSISFTGVTAFQTESNYRFEFDWNTSVGSTSNKSATFTLLSDNTANKLFYIKAFTTVGCKEGYGVVYNSSDEVIIENLAIDCKYLKSGNFTSMYHFLIEANKDGGISLTITDGTNVILNSKKISEEYSHITGIGMSFSKKAECMGFDNLLLSVVGAKEGISVPSCSITGTNDVTRTVSIIPGVGTEGTLAEATYYTTNGDEPTKESEKYTEPFTISESCTIKAVSYLPDGTASEVCEFYAEAGTVWPLNSNIVKVANLVAGEGEIRNVVIDNCYNNDGVLNNPSVTFSYTFNGEEVALPYTVTEDGTLVATVSADGYASQTEEMALKGQYTVTRSVDFTAMTSEYFAETYTDWTLVDDARLANWSSRNYTYPGATIISTYTLENIMYSADIPSNSYPLSILFGHGVGRAQSSRYRIVNPSEGDIAIFEINEVLKPTDTFVPHFVAYADDNTMTYTTAASQLVAKVSVYSPVRELTVTDGKNFVPEYNYYTSATYTRSIAAGAYGTICLPFAPDEASLEAYNFYELTASTVNGTEGSVTFTKVVAPEANKPYIYCLADGAVEGTSITCGATEVSSEAGTTSIGLWEMVGSFTKQEVDCTDKAIYALINDGATQKLMKVTQTLTVPPYRAYIQGVGNSINETPQSFTVRISGPTGIEQISAADVEGLLPATIYDLMGRPVQNPQKGHLYIQGGKKVVY